MTIGERIAQLLKEQGKKAKDLAEHLGISASAVTGWVQGSYPSSQYLVKISEFLGVSVEFILTGQGSASGAINGLDISSDALQVAYLWESLGERSRTIVLAKIYERIEVEAGRESQGDLGDAPILKQA